MQLPVSRSLDTQPSMFEAILEECSCRQIQIEDMNNQHYQNVLLEHQIFKEHIPGQPNIWFKMDQVPFDSILEEQEPVKQDLNLEFNKVKSFREEQETKIAQFLKDDRHISLRKIQVPYKKSSPLGKLAQSLSPRKTKKIDKAKAPIFFPQSD